MAKHVASGAEAACHNMQQPTVQQSGNWLGFDGSPLPGSVTAPWEVQITLPK